VRPGLRGRSLAGKARAGKLGTRCQNPQALLASANFDHNQSPSNTIACPEPPPRRQPAGMSSADGAHRCAARALAACRLGLRCMTMTEIVLRVRLISGEHLDVTYEEAGRTPDEAVDHIISFLADDSGTLRCKHGDRLIVLFGRGVATVEVAPRGAVL
jgi:hypothetical protein